MDLSEILQPGLTMPFTLQVERLSNKVMYFAIEPIVKEWLQRSLAEGPYDEVPAAECFLCFPSCSDRVNFVRVNEVKKLNFSLNEIKNDYVYYDNFDLYPRSPGGIINCDPQASPVNLPSMIVEMRNQQDLLVFPELDMEINRVELNEVNLWQPFYFKSGFMPVINKTGVCEYIPVANIAYFETCASLVSPQDPWGEFDEG